MVRSVIPWVALVAAMFHVAPGVAIGQSPLELIPKGSFTASEAQPHDGFGTAVSGSERWLAVGAPYHDFGRGAVFLFVRDHSSPNGWREVQKIQPINKNTASFFGSTLRFDKKTLVVGASQSTVGGVGGAGIVFVFGRGPGGWRETARIENPEPMSWAQFGVSLDVEGNTLAVGAHGSGSVYIFERRPGKAHGWLFVQRVALVPGDWWDLFGYALDLDGDTLVVGAPRSNDQRGSIVRFVRRPTGRWELTQHITSFFTQAFWLGTAVTAKGSVIAGGAEFAPSFGSLHVFRNNDAGTWVEAQVVPGGGIALENFGSELVLHGDLLLVGNPRYSLDRPGVVYVFQPALDGSDFTETLRLQATPPLSGDCFGYSLAVFDDIVVVGAPACSAFAGVDPGRVYTFEVLD